MRKLGVLIALGTLAALYFSPDASAFGRRHRGGGCECGESCGCGDCGCGEGRRGLFHRRHRDGECCEHRECCERVSYSCCGCQGGYVAYQPVVYYRPVYVQSGGCCGCTGGQYIIGRAREEEKAPAKPPRRDHDDRHDRDDKHDRD